MRRWYVVVSGPTYWTDRVVEYLPGVWDGPTEEGRDVAYVWARTAKHAVKAAVRKWQRGHKPRWNGQCCYPHQQRMDGLNPFAGVKATRLPAEEQRAMKEMFA